MNPSWFVANKLSNDNMISPPFRKNITLLCKGFFLLLLLI